jgi:hypothetical protein
MLGLKDFLEGPLLLKQRRLAADRPPMSKESFVDAVASTDLGRSAANMLWEKLAEITICDQFTPYPDDDLLKAFGLAEEDLDEDLILEIIKATGSVAPDRNMLANFGSVNTPSDIIRLIEASNRSLSGEVEGKSE